VGEIKIFQRSQKISIEKKKNIFFFTRKVFLFSHRLKKNFSLHQKIFLEKKFSKKNFLIKKEKKISIKLFFFAIKKKFLKNFFNHQRFMNRFNNNETTFYVDSLKCRKLQSCSFA